VSLDEIFGKPIAPIDLVAALNGDRGAALHLVGWA
jgi:hypothetical protein